jgi:CHAT domain-containing protein
MALPFVEQLERFAVERARKHPNYSRTLDSSLILINLANQLMALGRSDEAEDAAYQGLRYAERRGDKPDAWTYATIAHAAGMRGDYSSQQRHLLRALDLTKSEGSALHMAGRYLDLGLSESASSVLFLRSAIATLDDVASAANEDETLERKDLVCSALVALVERAASTDDESRRLDRDCAYWADARSSERDDPIGYGPMALSRVALARDDAARAIELARNAVRLNRLRRAEAALSSRGLVLASALLHLGRAQCASGDHAHGVESLFEAKRILERSAPRSDDYLQVLEALGRCLRRLGRTREGAALLERALALAESRPQGRARATMGRAFGMASLEATSRELAGALADGGAFAPAFEALERGRARVYRAMLAERDVTPAPVAASLARRRSALWLEYDATQKMLEQAGVERTRTDVSRLQSALALLSLRMDALDEEIRRAMPGHSTLPTSLEQTTRALPPDTLLLEYSVEADRCRVFVIGSGTTRTTLTVYTVPVSSRQLAGAVSSFRAALERRGTKSLPEVQRQGAALYELLMRPADDAIRRARRVVIVPDGPLYDLPFAALVRAGEPWSYLVQWRPVSMASSAAAVALVRRERRQTHAGPIVAVGDAVLPDRRGPVAPGSAFLRRSDDVAHPPPIEDDPDGSEETRGSSGSAALPGTRREVERIAQLLGPSVQTLLGPEATEARVKALPSTTRVLHLATHAVVNNVLPLNAGLRLTPPARQSAATPLTDNGFLQAWEIVDQMRLDAELVTVSACDSARGRVLAGEGAVSIARAFLYAGARSVVSALWSIDDSATAVLMAAFYAGLKDGLEKDEALRRAQVSFIEASGPDARLAAPAYWAAFELSGDWAPMRRH